MDYLGIANIEVTIGENKIKVYKSMSKERHILLTAFKQVKKLKDGKLKTHNVKELLDEYDNKCR